LPIRRSRPSRRASSSISVNSQRITSLGTPTSANDAVNKTYVDSLIQGLETKAPVRLATAAALPANANVAGVLTATAFGALTVDGVAVAVNDRILVKNEASSQNDGIYVVTATGGGAAFYVLTRASDMNTASEFPGAYVLSLQGTANTNRGWTLVLDPDTAFVVNTTAQTWLQFTGVGDLTAGSGITFTGNTVSVSTTLPDNYTMGASGTALTVTNNITAGSLTCSTHASAGGAALALNAAASGINFQLAGVTKADLGTTSATALTLAAGISYSGAAGSGALSFGSMTGDTTLTTGALTYAGASGKAATIGTTAAALTLQTTTSGTIALTSAGAANITGAAASTFAFSGGAFILQTTSQALTIQTLTSGTLLIDSAGALNLGTAAATGVTIGRSNQSVIVAGGLLCNSEFRLASPISPTSLSSNQTDYNPASIAACNVVRQDCSAPVTINSLQGNTANRTIMWWNISSTSTNTQTFLHDDGATGTAAMRFLCPNNVSYVLKGNAGVPMRYDGTSSRWRILANA
jgi:sulfur carrier protein ThiS